MKISKSKFRQIIKEEVAGAMGAIDGLEGAIKASGDDDGALRKAISDFVALGSPDKVAELVKAIEDYQYSDPYLLNLARKLLASKIGQQASSSSAEREKLAQQINERLQIIQKELEKILVEETVKAFAEAWESESDATRRMASRFQQKPPPSGRPKFTGGSIDIEPLSDDEHAASTEAYYELYNVLLNSDLPGDKPSDKLQYALRWIAKFEQGGAAGEAGFPQPEEGYEDDEPVLRQRGDGSFYYSTDEEERYTEGIEMVDGETIVTGPDGDASPEARGLARQDDLQGTMLKAAMEISQGKAQQAYETLLRALSAAGIETDTLDL
jgi:hypothetical protein